MKTFTHVVLPIGILVVVVGVVAYVTQNTSRPPSTKKEKAKETPETKVAVASDLLAWDADLGEDDTVPSIVEFKSHNHKDFWFHNSRPETVWMSLQRKSCTCTNLEVGRFDLPDSHLQEILKKPSLTGWCILAASAKFEPLRNVTNDGGKRAEIPGTPAGAEPRPYLLRVNWEAKKSPGEVPVDRLKTEVRAEIDGGTSNVYEKDVAFTVVPPIGAMPRGVELGDIERNGRGMGELIVWSETRSRLNLKCRVALMQPGSPTEPCAEVAEPVALTADQLSGLPSLLGAQPGKMKPLCGYRIKITLYERRGDNKLDMGPLTRKVVLTFASEPFEETIEETRIPLFAVVKGEVRVIGGDQRDRIDLGSYKFDRGQSASVILVADNTSVELEIVNTSSSKLHAKLSEPKMVEVRRQWKLTVDMEPNSLVGEMPSTTMVTLRTKGPNSRLLRIPVTGRADR